MTLIPELRADLHAAAARRQHRTQRFALRARFGVRRRLGLVLAACVLAGAGTAVAAGVFSSDGRLVLGRVDCNAGTGLSGQTSRRLVTNAELTSGLSFTSYCRIQLYRHHDNPHPQNGLIACEKNPTTVAVYYASSQVDQCSALGLKPLPTGLSTTKQTIQALETRLAKLERSRDCWSPNALAAAVKTVLVRYGLTGWKVDPPAPAKTPVSPIALTGRCGTFLLANPSSGDPYGSLDSATRTVSLALTIPRSLNTTITRADNQIFNAFLDRCYSPTATQTLVDRTFAGTGLAPEIAVSTSPDGTKEFSTAEKHRYQQNCPVLFESRPSNDDHTVYVWLVADHGVPLKPGHPPTAADFQR